jgi:Domain of unknown function (DUF3472)
MRYVKRCIQAVLTALLAATTTAALATPADAVAADPHFHWFSGAANMWNLDQTMTITQDTQGRFFAHQIHQSGGDNLYIGLQNNANAPQRRLVFSVWNAQSGSGPSGSDCHTFGSEGVGWTCVRSFDWKVGTAYKLRVWKTNGYADGSVEWLGELYDPATASWQVAGYIRSAANQTGLTYSSNWIESFSRPTGSCETEPAAQMIVGYPVGNNGAATGSPNYGSNNSCGGHTATTVLDTTARTVTLAQ